MQKEPKQEAERGKPVKQEKNEAGEGILKIRAWSVFRLT